MTAGWKAFMLASAMVLGLVGGCAEVPTQRLLSPALLAGRLLEHRDQDGQVKRLMIQGPETWFIWDRNSIKGDDGGVLVKAELNF